MTELVIPVPTRKQLIHIILLIVVTLDLITMISWVFFGSYGPFGAWTIIASFAILFGSRLFD